MTLASVQHAPDVVPPVFAVAPDEVRRRRQELERFVEQQLRPGIDYGSIGGDRSRRVLFKPGAEKLCALFGFATEIEITQRVERWEDPGLFHYEALCRVRDTATGTVIAEGVGSCNSKESKYRWRKGGPECPECSMPLRESRHDPEWYCWRNQGGCGARFPKAEHPDWTMGRVENPDLFDQVNTFLKMATKRAVIDGALRACCASDLFTQDVEDDPSADSAPSYEAPKSAPAGRREPEPGGIADLRGLLTYALNELESNRSDVFALLDVTDVAGLDRVAHEWGGWQPLADELARLVRAQREGDA